MVQAGWLRSYIENESSGTMTFDWSEYGLTKIKQLSDIWSELGADTFNPEYASAFWQIILRAAIVKGFRNSF